VVGRLATERRLVLAGTIAVGDGGNDLATLQVAGEAIDATPTSAVRPHCETTVDSMEQLHRTFDRRGIVSAIVAIECGASRAATASETGSRRDRSTVRPGRTFT
jgi:hypothetical protein